MKILMINPPIRETAHPVVPSGLAYIAQVVRRQGYEISVLDINGLRLDKKKVLEYIKKSDANVFMIGGLITVYKYAKWLAEVIKRYHPEPIIIAGNSLASSYPEFILKNTRIDLLVIGEGESTVLELLKIISKNRKLKKLKRINGIAFRNGKKIIITKQRERIEDLDSIPFPAWDLFPMQVYTKKQIPLEEVEAIKGKVMHVVSGRGCPYRCIYCYHIFGYHNRLRSAESIIKELEILKEKYGVNLVYFSDDLFIVNRDWVIKLCNELIKRKLDINWVTTGRTNLVDLELLKKMKQAGCILIQYGIESGSQKMLNIMNKGVTVEQASNAIRMTREAGIIVSTSFMMGFPEEEKEDIEKTIKFCIDNDIHLVSIFFVTPYPGTALYEQVKRLGLIKDEEDFINKLGDATELTLNISKFSDKELLDLKNYIISKVRKAYFKKHKIEQLKWYIKKIKWSAEFLKKEGIIEFLKKVKKRF